jgi:RNA polymerase sigma factor (sigma-70 family)
MAPRSRFTRRSGRQRQTTACRRPSWSWRANRPCPTSVVKHRALNAARGARRRRDRETRAFAQRFLETQSADQFDRLDAIAVAEALDQLPAESREIVVMRIWGGLTYEEIAAALQISISTAHRAYGYALAALRQKLESPCSTKPNHKTTT